MLDLISRTAVITGAGSGIGRALALETTRRGMMTALADIDETGLEHTAALVRSAGGVALTKVLDVASAEQQEEFARQVFAHCAPVALVVANAGIVRTGPVSTLDLEAFKLMIDVNLIGVANSIAAFVPRLRTKSLPARFVITGSLASLTPIADFGGYAATKHAVWALAEALSSELAECHSPVGVSLMCPGGVDTAIMDRSGHVAGFDDDEERTRLNMSPEAFAKKALDLIVTERFWIFTHDYLESVRPRFARIFDQEQPRFWTPAACPSEGRDR